MSDQNTVIFQKTLVEFIAEIKSILDSGKYEVPEAIRTDLDVADVVVKAAPPEVVSEIMHTFGKFVIQFEPQIKSKDADFFNRLEVCRACTSKDASAVSKDNHCHCKTQCTGLFTTKDAASKKTRGGCQCDSKCPNCSELLKELDSKTLVGAKYIIEQAVLDPSAEKSEDIDVIFDYVASLLAAAKNYKKR